MLSAAGLDWMCFCCETYRRTVADSFLLLFFSKYLYVACNIAAHYHCFCHTYARYHVRRESVVWSAVILSMIFSKLFRTICHPIWIFDSNTKMLSDAINLRSNISGLLEFTDKLPLLWDYIMAIIQCVCLNSGCIFHAHAHSRIRIRTSCIYEEMDIWKT